MGVSDSQVAGHVHRDRDQAARRRQFRPPASAAREVPSSALQRDRLTDTQRRILASVREWIVEHGEGPTIREIGQQVGLSSTSSTAYQLGKLEEHGMIIRRARSWRSFRLS
ncbi:hypothetical protein [Streptomyces sp.]|uniref:LexA family protein n=1 Tax=Streptomyces sp. TaxID=1931 RepID=UPI002D77FA74|nr:hypothetical protein [Streptomyces sp.]HET6356488.1 hypothetical protein [Streptomyces sp.]